MPKDTKKTTTNGNELEVQQNELRRVGGLFAERIEELDKRKLSELTASMAQELAVDGKRYLAAVHAVFDGLVSAAFAAHRRATELRGKFLKPGDDAVRAASATLKRWELERARRNQAVAEARAALQRAAAPNIPAPVVVNEDAGKLAGVSSVKKFRGEVIDLPAFLRFIADTAPLHYLVSVEQGNLDRYLNASGGIPLPGIEVKPDIVIRVAGPKGDSED